MQIASAVAGYLVFIFIGGALLAPLLYFGLHSLSVSYPALNWLADHAFHRYVSRCFTIMAVIGLKPFLNRIGVKSWSDIGFQKGAGRARLVSWGFFFGWTLLFLAALLTILCGVRILNPDHTAHDIIRHVRNAGLASLFAAVFEEAVFRGVFFYALRHALGIGAALCVSSLLYATAHFVGDRVDPSPIGWFSGLEVLAHTLNGISSAQTSLPMFCNLTMAGVILAVACHQYGSLYFSIGLHAGFIFWVKSFGFFTRPTGKGPEWFWGGSKLVDGWMAFLLLGLLLVVCLRVLPFRTKDANSSPPPG